MDDIQQWDSTEEEKTTFTSIELQELIDNMLENVPADKKEKKEWKKTVNQYITDYNDSVGRKVYKLIQ